MDIRAILKARNLSDENIETLISNPAYSSVLEGFIQDAESGKTALLKAQEIEENLKNWNQNEVIPYVRKADMEKAAVSAENAALKKHLETLKGMGYDIPESMLPAAPQATPQATPQGGFDQAKLDEQIFNGQKAQMELISLSNRYRGLTGNELDPVAEYEDFGKNRRPQETLRTYIDRKYDLAGVEAKKNAEKEAARIKSIEDAAIEKYKKENPISASPELVRPRPTKFERFANLEEGRTKAWQTEEGRNKATRDRLSKYTSLVTQ